MSEFVFPSITTPDLTEVSVTGAGVFDVLMRATKAHLEEEYTKGRIKGNEYATVYLGSLTQVLQTSVQFLLERDKAGLEAKLVEQQVILAQAQVEKAKAETDLVRQQIENSMIEQKLLDAQVCKLKAEYDLIMEQKLKTVSEAALLAQKKVTEQAQTSGTGVDADSVIGKQKALYTAQTDGFQRDAEQKTAKALIDTWNVRRTTDDGTVADGTNMLDDATIGRAVSKLLAGINA